MSRLFVANWKMHKTVPEALEFAARVSRSIADDERLEVAIAPPYTALHPLSEALRGSAIRLAAQDLFWEDEGAYTGWVSGRMLADLGCRYVIVGHSERRRYAGETDSQIHRKVRAALRHHIRPILCVGETEEERRDGKSATVVEGQLDGALGALGPDQVGYVVIAYEPVWAIGTGVNATPKQANEMHRAIRFWVGRRFGDTIADRIRILYGGSVTPENVASLMAEAHVNGALIGGASLRADLFLDLIKNGMKREMARRARQRTEAEPKPDDGPV